MNFGKSSESLCEAQKQGVKSKVVIITDDMDKNDEVDVKFHAEPFKTFVALVFFLLCSLCSTTSLAIIHERVPQDPPIPDIFLDNTTYLDWGQKCSEYIICIGISIGLLIVLFHKHRFIVLRRIWFLLGLHYLYRSITMFVTVLPVSNSDLKCAPKLNSSEVHPMVIAQRAFTLFIGMGMEINGKATYCGEYIYSGHTMILVTTYLFIKEYSPDNWYSLHFASFGLSLIGVIVLLLGRGHYSVDVVIAFWITTRVWWLYHTMANNPNLKDSLNNNNYFSKMWWWHLFLFFEGNVPDCVPKEYNLPIPDGIIYKIKSCFGKRKAEVVIPTKVKFQVNY